MRTSLLLLTAALLLAACVSAPTYAETVPVSYIKYKWNNDTNTRETVRTYPADCVMLAKSTTSLDGDWYAADGTIDYEERLDIDGDVRLILKDGCSVTAKKGIRLTEGASLTIYAQSEGPATGRLQADNTDRPYEAAIGGGWSGSSTVTIFGGTVTANAITDYGGGAAIGGGDEGGGTVTIFGGTVNATASNYGAAIGGGYRGVGKVTIYGGRVTADASSGAAIGGGWSGSGAVTIHGGTVNATGNSGSAAIGGGDRGGGTVTIFGGTVDASVGDFCSSAAIGGGKGGVGEVTISGGRVTARTGEHSYGPAIGGGYESSRGTVSLGWTDAGDFVYANSYNADVTLTAPFEDAASGLVFPAGTASPADINGKKLVVPYWHDPDFTLPGGLTGIGGGAFSGVTAKAVLVPEGVTSVGERAFAGSGALKIRFRGNSTTIANTAFAGRALVIAFAPAGSTTLSSLSGIPGVIAYPLD